MTGADLSAEHTLTITINAVNDDPTYTIPASITIDEDNGLYQNDTFATGITTGGGTDEVGQTLAFTLSGYDASLFAGEVTLSNTGELLIHTGG